MTSNAASVWCSRLARVCRNSSVRPCVGTTTDSIMSSRESVLNEWNVGSIGKPSGSEKKPCRRHHIVDSNGGPGERQLFQLVALDVLKDGRGKKHRGALLDGFCGRQDGPAETLLAPERRVVVDEAVNATRQLGHNLEQHSRVLSGAEHTKRIW